MQELGSDVNLYALVFGESVLNDAVRVYFYFCYILCISVFRTITGCSQCSSHFFCLLCAKLQMAISLYRYFFCLTVAMLAG